MKKWLIALAGPIIVEAINVIWPLFLLDAEQSQIDSRAWISLVASGLIVLWAGWICVKRLNASLFLASVVGAALWVWSVLCTAIIDILVRVSSSTTAPAIDSATSMLLLGGLLFIPAAFMFAFFGAFLGVRLTRAPT